MPESTTETTKQKWYGIHDSQNVIDLGEHETFDEACEVADNVEIANSKFCFYILPKESLVELYQTIANALGEDSV